MAPLKAPRLDGMPLLFYYGTIDNDVLLNLYYISLIQHIFLIISTTLLSSPSPKKILSNMRQILDQSAFAMFYIKYFQRSWQIELRKFSQRLFLNIKVHLPKAD